MAKFPVDKLVTKILDGIGQAQKDYLEWSNGDDLESAPEYFVTTSISRKIRGIRSHDLWITLEHNIRRALKEANATKRGRPSQRLQLSGRYDIVVWRKNNTPRCVIEVKHRVTGYNQQLKSDVSRICEAFSNPKMKMQAGFLAFYTFAWEREYKDGSVITPITLLNKRVDKIYDAIKSDAAPKGVKVDVNLKVLSKDQDTASFAVVFRLNRAIR